MAPQPKAELVAELTPDCITFWYASEDARLHIERHAPQYGALFSEVLGRACVELFISPAYDITEVARHLIGDDGVIVDRREEVTKNREWWAKEGQKWGRSL